MTDKLITYSVVSAFSVFSLSAQSPTLRKTDPGWRFLTETGLFCATLYGQHDHNNRSSQTAYLSTKIANTGTFVNFLAINQPTTHYLPKAVNGVQNNSNLPPNLVLLQISRQITHSTMCSRRYKAVLINSSNDSEMEMEIQKEGGDPNTEPTQEVAVTDSSIIPKLNKSSDSSELMGYTTMKNTTPKDEMDKNHNNTGNVTDSEPLIVPLESASDSNT